MLLNKLEPQDNFGSKAEHEMLYATYYEALKQTIEPFEHIVLASAALPTTIPAVMWR